MVLPKSLLALLCLSVLAVAGCAPSDSEPTAQSDAQPAVAGGVEPFTPPTLAELDAKADWIDQPVVDPFERLQGKLSEEKPAISAAEALKLPNKSREANAKILGALGRLPAEEKDVDYGATFNRHWTGDVNSTNPLLYNSTAEFDYVYLTSISLLGFDWTMTPFALSDTVRSWQTSKDHYYDKIVLRDDLTWSDGKPLTAHDIVFSFQTIMHPKVIVPAVRTGTSKLRWVEAYDDHTVVYFHKEPLATHIDAIEFPIIPKHIYEKTLAKDYTMRDSAKHVALENDPVTSGQYQVKSRERGQEMVLTRRESWYMHGGKQVRRKPYFETVRFRIKEDPNTTLLSLRAGNIDEMLLTPAQWMTQTDGPDFYRENTKVTGVEWTEFFFQWNSKKPDGKTDSPFFSDRRVRQAMSYAFNHQEMLENLCYGLYEPCNGIFHNSAWMAPKNPPKPYQHDVERARQLLEEAGWEDHDGDGVRDKEINGKSVPFAFAMIVSGVPERVAICELMQQNLADIGIECNVQKLETTALIEKLSKKDYEASFGGWGTGTDPDTTENIWGTGQARNYVNYSNPGVDELYKQGRQEFDREKRAAIYARIHEIIYEDQPCTWLYFRNGFYGFNRNLRGYYLSPRGPFHYQPGSFSQWKMVP